MQSPVTVRNQDDLGKLVLRLALGIMMLLHGISKLTNGISGIEGMVVNAGFPAVFAYLVYVGEVLAPILLIIGYLTRPAALIMAINMIVAVYLAHMSQLFQLSKTGGWAIELQGFFFFTALAVALLGAGRYSVGGLNGRFN